MYEYMVEKYSIEVVQDEMNRMAQAGWRVVAVCCNSQANDIVVTYERIAY